MAVKKSKAKTAKQKTAKKAAPKKKVAAKAVKKTTKPKKTSKVVTKKKVAAKAKPKKAKKVVKKKIAAKKKAAPKKKLAVKKVVKKEAIPAVKDKPFTKSEMCQAIAGHIGITKKQVGEVLEALSKVAGDHLKKKHPFILPGMLKVTSVYKPAKKARKGINPFTGEEMMFKAKPAHYVVKVRALKKLKEMV